MWPRRVLCFSTDLNLDEFIIPDASSHPPGAEFILNSPELETRKNGSNTGRRASHPSVLLLKALIFSFLMVISKNLLITHAAKMIYANGKYDMLLSLSFFPLS